MAPAPDRYRLAISRRNSTSALSTALIRLVLTVFCLAWANPSLPATDPDTTTKPTVASHEPIPEAAQLEFARAMEQAANDRDIAAMNSLMDWDQLMDRVMAGEDSPALNQLRARFKASFLTLIKAGDGPFVAISRNSELGGTFKFLRLDYFENEPIATFRLKSADYSASNYIRFQFKTAADNVVRAHDFYTFSVAEHCSDVFRRFWIPAAAELSASLNDHQPPAQNPLVAAIKLMPKFTQLESNQKFEQVLEEYNKLPEVVRKEKVFLLLRLKAASQISDKEYQQAISDFRTFHPSDPALDFLLIDAHFQKKEFQKTIEYLDVTNKRVGGDASLLSIRANVLARLGRFDEARETAKAAIRMEDDWDEAYWAAVTVSVLAKDDDETVQNLQAFESELGREVGDLSEDPLFSEFIKSPQYAKWIKSRE